MYFANGLSSSIGGSSGLSGSIFSLSHLRPRADQRNVAVLGDDGGGRRLVGGAAVVVVVGVALGEAAAEFAAEGGAVDGGEETQRVDIVLLDCATPEPHDGSIRITPLPEELVRIGKPVSGPSGTIFGSELFPGLVLKGARVDKCLTAEHAHPAVGISREAARELRGAPPAQSVARVHAV